ncbi:MAG: hypothetical protein K0S44_2294 [Bacteroidetes bacterium]|jgi:hypothetical protein|nr:hypothetical protein [Bacteroidota bacterium]
MKTKIHLLPIIAVICLAAFTFSYTVIKDYKISGYNLSAPQKRLTLPDILMEISGITLLDANTFACVQDENGVIFIYDIIKNEIKDQYRFNIDGDYEGITRVENALYVLRSDGMLFEISDYRSKSFKLNSYVTGIPAQNNEGLCYDAVNKKLLIACKSPIAKGPASRENRAIYAFDLKTKKLDKVPVFNFNVSAIKDFAIKNKVPLEMKEKKKGQINEPILRFRTSAIGIHPVSKKLYLLSAADHMIFIFDMKGNIEYAEKLNVEMFNKAEGITFRDNGDMFITNEGQTRKPTVLIFPYKN